MIVHGGLQSMPLDYNNINAPFYSEAEREFAGTRGLDGRRRQHAGPLPPRQGVEPRDSLYVTLEDSSQKTATVKHPNPAIIKSGKWNPWRIPLTEFAGVNAARIKKIFIGIGDKSLAGARRHRHGLHR